MATPAATAARPRARKTATATAVTDPAVSGEWLLSELPPIDDRNPGITIATNPLFPGITSRLVCVFADEADIVLTTMNKHPRPRRSRQQQGIERDILTGRWVPDGTSVCHQEDGLLQNGQHRYYALVAAQKTENLKAAEEGRPARALYITTFIVEGLPAEARRVQDTNARLSAGDWATMNGVEYAAAVVALAKLVFAYERTTERGPAGHSSTTATNTEVEETLSRHPELHRIAKQQSAWSTANKDMRGLKPSVAGFALWLFTYKDLVGGWEFIRHVWDGVSGDPMDPAIVFRKRLQSGLSGGEKIYQPDQMTWLIRAWNVGHGVGRLSDVRSAKNGMKAADIPDAVNGPRRGEPVPAEAWADMVDTAALEKRLGLLPGHTEEL